MLLTTIPRTLVKIGLNGLRLPLTAVERVAGNAQSLSWPPTLAYESFESKTKSLVGSLLRDDQLTREGQLQGAKVAELVEAKRLEAAAERKRLQADAELEAQQQRADEARDRIAEQAAVHERQLEQEKVEKERAVRAETLRREQSLNEVNEARQKAVALKERAAEKTRVTEESAALAKRGAALGAKRTVQAVDQALEIKRAQRKNN